MSPFRQIGITLAVISATVPLYAVRSAADSTDSSSGTAKIRAQFAAKDATISTLRQQLADEDSQIADLKKQLAAKPEVEASVAAQNLAAQNIASPSSAFQASPIGVGPGKGVHLALTTASNPMTDVLASLSKQAGVPILTDDTVTGSVGAMVIDQPDVMHSLDQLKKADSGLTWQAVYLPQDAKLPSGNALSRKIQDLKALSTTQLAVADPTAKTFTTFSQKKSDALTSVPEGMQTVYLVTNETVRAQRLAALAQSGQAMANLPQGDAESPVGQAVTGLQGTTNLLGQMSPEQQRQAIPLMFQQFGQMIQKIDPAVRRDLITQFMTQQQQRMQQTAPGQ